MNIDMDLYTIELENGEKLNYDGSKKGLDYILENEYTGWVNWYWNNDMYLREKYLKGEEHNENGICYYRITSDGNYWETDWALNGEYMSAKNWLKAIKELDYKKDFEKVIND